MANSTQPRIRTMSRGLTSLFSDRRIGTKVWIGFGVVLALLISVAAAGLFGLRKNAQSFDGYEAISDRTVRAVAIERNFVGLRRNVLVYTTSGSERALARIRELVAALKSEMAALNEALTVAENKSRLQAIRQMVDQYTQYIEEAVSLRVSRERAVTERLHPVGAKARRNLSEVRVFVESSG